MVTTYLSNTCQLTNDFRYCILPAKIQQVGLGG